MAQNCPQRKGVCVSNNFNLIRLAAAIQVAILHMQEHLGSANENSIIIDFIRLFPGVPIFFFVSGFLISKSYEKNPRLLEYGQNRILRIYPALLVCVTISLLSVWVSGYFNKNAVGIMEVIPWYVSQVTIFQFYNPDFLRGYGVGVLNGSLWTITVELQFYLLVPIIYRYYFHRFSNCAKAAQFYLILGFLLLNRLYFYYQPEFRDHLIYKLLGVSFMPWFYMFLVGVVAQKNLDFFHRHLAGSIFYVAVAYGILSSAAVGILGLEVGNSIGPLLFFLIAVLVFSAAYSQPACSDRLLGKNDISYGIYIYHMPVVNMLLYFGVAFSLHSMLFAFLLVVFAAIFSWICVEKPSLRFKRHPLNPFTKDRYSRSR